MNMLRYVPDFEKEYEKQYGKKADVVLIRFVEQLNKVGKNFEDKGREDAARGLPVPSDDAFLAWGKKTFDDDPEMAESMSDLMKMCYMDGYEGEVE